MFRAIHTGGKLAFIPNGANEISIEMDGNLSTPFGERILIRRCDYSPSA